MAGLALIISIIALILAYKAYNMNISANDESAPWEDSQGMSTDTIRTKTADALNLLEKKVRGEKNPDADYEENVASETDFAAPETPSDTKPEDDQK